MDKWRYERRRDFLRSGWSAEETVKELDFESRGFGRSDNYFAV